MKRILTKYALKKCMKGFAHELGIRRNVTRFVRIVAARIPAFVGGVGSGLASVVHWAGGSFSPSFFPIRVAIGYPDRGKGIPAKL